jgi:hypothetical protein
MMKIEIDEEVYAALKGRAIPFEDKTPNDVLRRLLGFAKAASGKVSLTRTPRVDLPKLVEAGLLKEGQVLHLKDFQGRRVPDSEATIHQGALRKDGIIYSMSKLAKDLFQQIGYTSKTVPGPVYWYTEDNVSIKSLWDDYLEKNSLENNSNLILSKARYPQDGAWEHGAPPYHPATP